MHNTPPARTRILEPTVFHFSFFRSLHSELGKLLASRGMLIAGFFGVLYSFVATALTIYVMSLFDESNAQIPLEPSYLTDQWSDLALFIIPMAVLAVSSEYTYNTMHTTLLAVPRRILAFATKLTAVAIYCGVLSLLMIISSFIAALAFGDTHGYAPNTASALLVEWVILTTLALGAAGITYLIRSTAGSIVVLIGMLKFLSFLTLIPHEKTQDVLQRVLPDQVASSAMHTGSVSQFEIMLGVTPSGWTWGIALAIWFLYMALFIALGIVRFLKPDA